MATITITIADGNIGDVRTALCDYRGGYKQTLEDGTPNPESKAEMAARVLKGVVRDILRQHRQEAAARSAATPDVESL
jgi:hypothetical protein